MFRFIRNNRTSMASVAAILLLWEVAAHLAPVSPLQSSPIIPPWEQVFGRSFISMADYWRIDMWAPVPQSGGERTILGAILALGYHSLWSWTRVLCGLLIGMASGITAGIILSESRFLRRLCFVPLHILRMTPLLALIPLFQFWIGATDLSAIIFVAFGVFVPFLLGTVNAVANIPPSYIDSARTLGASGWMLQRSVILPAILPELSSTLLMCIAIAWSAVIGAEYIGVESGVGRIVIWSDFFSDTGRMMLAIVLIGIYVYASMFVVGKIQERALRWR